MAPAPDTKSKPDRGLSRKIKTATLLIAIVVGSVGAAATALKLKKESAASKKEAEALIKEVADLKEKTMSLLELNNKTEAAELTLSALEKFRRLEKLEFFKTSRVTLEEEFAKINRDLKRVEPINNPRMVLDLSANAAGFEPQGVSLGKNKVIVFGFNGFYKYDLNLRAGELDLSTENNLLYALENPSDPSQLWLLKNDRLIAAAAKNGPPQQQELWRQKGEALELKEMSYYEKALYFLSQAGLIYKLDLKTATSSNANDSLTPWLAPRSPNEVGLNSEENNPPTTNYSLPTTHYQLAHMAIDGDIYGLADQHKLIKLSNGEIQNQTELTEKVDQIITEPDFDYIYLLARAENMILVMDKRDRAVKKRLSHPDLGQAKSFAVDYRERTVYFLKDKTVYSFEI